MCPAILFTFSFCSGMTTAERHVLGPVWRGIIHQTLSKQRVIFCKDTGISVCMHEEPRPASAALSLGSALSYRRHPNKPPCCNARVPSRCRENKEGAVGRRCAAGSCRHVLHSELVRSHGDAVDELHRAPQAVEFHALVHVHHPVAGQGPTPDGVVQEGSDPCQDNLKHGQAAAQAFFGQQVPFPRDCYLLRQRETKRKILVIQSFLFTDLFKVN